MTAALVDLIAASNRTILDHWLALVGTVVLLAGVVSAYRYRQDRRWVETNAVSAEPLEADALVSVLVPAWNEAEIISDSIRAFRELDYPHRELVVCAGGDDGTFGAAEQAANGDERVTVLEQTRDMNKQAALNTCLAHARGEVLYLVDGDCVLDDATWNAALRPVVDGEETVVHGASRPLEAQWGRWLPTYQHVKETYERARRPRYVRGLLGRNVVVERDAMDELGEFDESVEAGTDYNLAKRLLEKGHRIRFVPNSRMASRYPTTVRGYFAQQSRWLRNVFFLGREWAESGEVRSTVVTCLVGTGMLVMPVVGLAWWPLLVAWGGLMGYGALSRVRWVRFFEKERLVTVPMSATVGGVGLMVVEFTAWAFALYEIAVPSRRRKW